MTFHLAICLSICLSYAVPSSAIAKPQKLSKHQQKRSLKKFLSFYKKGRTLLKERDHCEVALGYFRAAQKIIDSVISSSELTESSSQKDAAKLKKRRVARSFLFFSMALTFQSCDKHKQAFRSFHKFLEEAPTGHKTINLAKEHLKKLRSKVRVKVKISVWPKDALLYIKTAGSSKRHFSKGGSNWSLVPGTHTVEIRKKFFKTLHTKLVIEYPLPDLIEKLYRLKISSKKVATLHIKTVPPFANLTMQRKDGTKINATTPFDTKVKSGKLAIFITHSKHRSLKKTIWLDPGEKQIHTFYLSPIEESSQRQKTWKKIGSISFAVSGVGLMAGMVCILASMASINPEVTEAGSHNLRTLGVLASSISLMNLGLGVALYNWKDDIPKSEKVKNASIPSLSTFSKTQQMLIE